MRVSSTSANLSFLKIEASKEGKSYATFQISEGRKGADGKTVYSNYKAVVFGTSQFAFDKLNEKAKQDVTKMRVAFEGTMSRNPYKDKDGNEQNDVQLIITDISILESASTNSSTTASAPTASKPSAKPAASKTPFDDFFNDDSTEDIPF